MPETLFSNLKKSKKSLESGETLVSLNLNPSSLSMGAVMAAAFAAEHGRTEHEQDEVVLLVRQGEVILAADWDTGTTATNEGIARPMRFRFKLSGEKSAVPTSKNVAWVGVKVKVADLIVALRNKVENSELYSVLSENIDLQIRANTLGTAPGEVVVIPGDSGKERVVAIRGTVDQATIEELEPATSATRVGDIGADLLLEAGLIASDEAGVYLHPGSANIPSYLAAVGPKGAVVAAFGANNPDLLTDIQANGIKEPVVASARLIKTLGFLQEPITELARVRAKNKITQEVARIWAAFIASCLEDTSMLGALYQLVGTPSALEMLSGDSQGENTLGAAEAFSTKISESLGLAGAQAVAKSLLQTATKELPMTLKKSIEAKTGEANKQELMRAYLGQESPENRLNNLAVALGEYRISQDARAISQVPEGEALRRPDVALGAVRASGKKVGEVVESLMSRIDSTQIDAWWANMETYCAQLKVSEAVLADLKSKAIRNKGQLPLASSVKVPDSVRAAWLSEAMTEVQGRFFAGAAGRVGAGWVDQQGISLMLTDLAIEPDPAKYPLKPEQVASILAAKPARQLEATLYSADVSRTAGRVVGMTSPDRANRLQNNLVSGPLFLARWVPDGQEALAGLKGKERWIITPETGWVDDKHVSLPRRPADFPIAPVTEAGTLRIYGLAPDGEKQYLHLPMKAVKVAGNQEPVVFALDAERLQELAGFASNRGKETILRVERGLVQLSDPTLRFIALVPTVGIDRLPDSLKTLAQTGGVEAQTVNHPISQAIYQVAKRPTPRLNEARKPKVNTPGIGFVEMQEEKEALVVAGGLAVGATSKGVKALASDDVQRRHWDRELAELNQILKEFPGLTDGEVKALVKVKGSIGGALKSLLVSPSVTRQIEKSVAWQPLKALVAGLRERKLEAPELDGEPLDLFATNRVKGTEDEVLQEAWKSFMGALKRVRRKLDVRKQDLEMARGIQMPVVQGEVRPEAANAQIVVESLEAPEEEQTKEPERRKVRI